MTIATDQLLLRVDEAARLLGISRSHLYDEIAAGSIPSVRIGTARRIPRRALEEYVARLAERDGAEHGSEPVDRRSNA